ncbi:MAG: 1-acyl-sn-glycerol-3-phosphate acyltransferase [Fibrobacteria bacterium]
MKAQPKLPVFNPLAARMFETVFLPMRGLRLGGLHFLNLPETLPPGRPVLLVGNHVSNWDGFMFREIQRRLKPKWPIYSVMLEEELRRYPFLRLMGGMGMRPGSPASVASCLRRVAALRARTPDFFLSFFPQGRIYPSFKKPLQFHAGVDLFIRAMAPLTLLPAGLHMEPLRGLAPSFLVSLGRPMRVDKPSAIHRVLEDLVQAQTDKLHALLCRHGEDFAEQVDPHGLRGALQDVADRKNPWTPQTPKAP